MMSSKKNKKNTSTVYVVIILICILIFALVLAFFILGPKETKKEISLSLPATTAGKTEPTEESTEQEPPATTAAPPPQVLPLPYETEGLEIGSFFPSSIPNPDGGNVMGDSICGVEIRNISDSYLKHAEIRVAMSDGKAYTFIVEDLPADATVWAFDTENRQYDGKASPETVDCTAVREEPDADLQKAVQADISGTEIMLTNSGAEDSGPLEIICKCKIEEACFGGISYCYPVENLAPGESTTVLAEDCYMGEAEVVCIRRPES